MDRGRRPFNNNRRQNNNQDSFQVAEVTQKLSKEFSDPVALYLESGKAYQYAKAFSNIKNHQMRKILDGVKEAVTAAKNGDFETGRKKMFVLVAMTAYNAGRLKGDMNKLYTFISKTINEKSIKDADDIYAFDQFFTSIVAYHTKIARG